MMGATAACRRRRARSIGFGRERAACWCLLSQLTPEVCILMLKGCVLMPKVVRAVMAPSCRKFYVFGGPTAEVGTLHDDRHGAVLQQR